MSFRTGMDIRREIRSDILYKTRDGWFMEPPLMSHDNIQSEWHWDWPQQCFINVITGGVYVDKTHKSYEFPVLFPPSRGLKSLRAHINMPMKMFKHFHYVNEYYLALGIHSWLNLADFEDFKKRLHYFRTCCRYQFKQTQKQEEAYAFILKRVQFIWGNMLEISRKHDASDIVWHFVV